MKNAAPFLLIVLILGGSLTGMSVFSWLRDGWSDDLWVSFTLCISLVVAAVIHVKKVKEESNEESLKR